LEVETMLKLLPGVLSVLHLANAGDPACDNFAILNHTYLSSHNSYHERKTGVHTTSISSTNISVSIPVFSYDWPSITELLENGVCGFEIDLFPNENASSLDGSDLAVQHIYNYDNESSCQTLSECIAVIIDFASSNAEVADDGTYTGGCPIFVGMELKLEDDWTDDAFWELNNLIVDAFAGNEDLLYTPLKHGADSADEHWPAWTDQIGTNQIFFAATSRVAERLFPDAVDPLNATQLGDVSLEMDFAIFPRCDYPRDVRYCVVGRKDEYDDDDELYLFVSQIIAEKVTQLADYPIYDSGIADLGFVVNLPDAVTEDLNYWREQLPIDFVAQNFPPTYSQAVINGSISNGSVPWKWWNAWSIFAYLDAVGNNDGKLDALELADFAYEAENRDEDIFNTVYFIMTTPLSGTGHPLSSFPWDSFGLADVTLGGLYVNNPLLWICGASILDDPSFNSLVPIEQATANTEAQTNETCSDYRDGYHYLKSDYPYQYRAEAPFDFVVNEQVCEGETLVFFDKMECTMPDVVNDTVLVNTTTPTPTEEENQSKGIRGRGCVVALFVYVATIAFLFG